MLKQVGRAVKRAKRINCERPPGPAERSLVLDIHPHVLVLQELRGAEVTRPCVSFKVLRPCSATAEPTQLTTGLGARYLLVRARAEVLADLLEPSEK